MNVLATEKSKANVPVDPPINDPNVPEYVIGEETVGVDVAIVATFPLLPTYAEP